MRRPLALVLALLACGCGSFGDAPGSRLVCSSDADCGDNEVCFANGCGDPGRDIMVEVRPNPLAGLHEQDFPVENLRPRHHFELFGPALLQGQVLRQTAPDSVGTAYTQSVSVRVTGESLLIPGLTRLYTSTQVPDNGHWRLPVGSGSYTITLQPSDTELPPQVQTRTVSPGSDVAIDFLLPASTSLTRLAGRLVREGTTLLDSDLEVQAFDDMQRPLSQRVPVSRATGDFLLTLPPEASRLSSVTVQATPLNRTLRPESLVPQKTFLLDPRLALVPTLELGDYGEPVAVSGRVLDSGGKPVAGASVYVQGKVGGGGSFRSASVPTDAEGRYTLRSLPSHPDTPLTLYVVPPADAVAGITVLSAVVPRADVTLPEARCPDRTLVRGLVQRPGDATPAAGVRVQAFPVGVASGWPLPADSVAGLTDESGHFLLRLDPGHYRLDFSPAENLPRVSRFVTVAPGQSLELPPFTLYKGRSVTGQVTLRDADGKASPAPYAMLRFFRVVQDGERGDTALLLGQTTSDSSGNYTVTMPTR